MRLRPIPAHGADLVETLLHDAAGEAREMHELSLSSKILSRARREAPGARVAAVRVRVGALLQVVPRSLAFCFGLAARGTECEGASLDVETIAARMECASCGAACAVREPPLRCGACGGGNVKVAAGEEFEVVSVVVKEQQCAAEP